MDMKPVQSSNIKAVGYDPASRKMRVQFGSGDAYDYEDVAPEKHAALIGSDSVGKHFHANIRGAHKAVKVGDEKTPA